MQQRQRIAVCYLCGDPLANGTLLSRDHIPPKSLFPDAFRRENNLSRLETLPTHKHCNNDFSSDEQYFVYSLSLVCSGSEVGKYVAEHVLDSAEKGRNRPLHLKVKDEFYANADDGLLYKTFEHERLYRVAYKIVRGLWFHRAGTHQVLPTSWRVDFRMYDRNLPPPPVLEQMMSENVQWGEYPDVFFFTTTSSPNIGVHLFNLVFWRWVLINVTLHEPSCSCARCERNRYERVPTHPPSRS